MKIKNFIPDGNTRDNGLIFKEMRGLKQVVALFGKNGSGKSRLLKQLKNEIDSKIRELDNKKHKYYTPFNSNDEQNNMSFDEMKSKILEDIEYNEGDSIISITGRGITIASHENMNDDEYRSGGLNLYNNPDFETVKKNCAKFIKSLCKSEMAQVYHENVSGKKKYEVHDDVVLRNIKLFKLLQEVVKKIMDKDLSYATDEHLTPIVKLDGRVLVSNELSDGERELLAYCTYLVLQQQDDVKNKTLSLKGKVLLLDELELFLHPKAQIDLIKGLRDLVGENGQIWIATHSLAILSILDRDEIWLMDNGDIISPSIETPNKVLSSLVGEDNIDALENFISSQYEWASIQFALESLFPPQVVPFNEGDVQQGQVRDRLSAPKTPIKVLDFGAGDGRIAQEIIRNPDLASKIYYQPLEITVEKHPYLKELTDKLQKMSEIESTTAREVLDTHEKLNESDYSDFFDMIFMVNVLHEIPKNKWISILNTLLKSLKDDGKIIILEDQAIPRGENAHEYGFLILNIEEFKLLFSLQNLPKEYKHLNPKYTDRLSCVEIPKNGSKVTAKSISNALERKKTNCKTEINRLRAKKDKTAKDGRLNSFLTQLYANVSMALDDEKP